MGSGFGVPASLAGLEGPRGGSSLCSTFSLCPALGLEPPGGAWSKVTWLTPTHPLPFPTPQREVWHGDGTVLNPPHKPIGAAAQKAVQKPYAALKGEEGRAKRWRLVVRPASRRVEAGGGAVVTAPAAWWGALPPAAWRRARALPAAG